MVKEYDKRTTLLISMKRAHCIVEGQTEVRVFTSLLTPYIYEKTGCHIIFTPIKHTGGGIVKFEKIFTELRKHLSESDKIVTTFFDYYGINQNHNFQNYNEAKVQQTNPKVGINLLERGMTEYLSHKGVSTRNFIPYIQIHEFEAILFSSQEGFEFQYDNDNIIRELQDIRNRYPNPEDINDSPLTAPSKRIKNILKKHGEIYVKTADGEDIATIIGIDTIKNKCPRFNNWLETLIYRLS